MSVPLIQQIQKSTTISKAFRTHIGEKNEELSDTEIIIGINPNSFKIKIYKKRDMNSIPMNWVGRILGFSKRVLAGRYTYYSDDRIDLFSINNIRYNSIKCNIIDLQLNTSM